MSGVETKVIPFGAEMTGKVFRCDKAISRRGHIIGVFGADDEGYIIVGEGHAFIPVVGERVNMRFTDNGQGGFWRIVERMS